MFIYACFNYAYSCLVGFALQRFLKKTKLCGKLLIQKTFHAQDWEYHSPHYFMK